MDFCHSKALERGTYRDDGLAHGIPLRVHSDQFKEIEGALRAQKDWSKYVSPVKNYQGGLGSRFSFIRVTIPECLPERLEIMSYANEYAFLYDDQMENLDLKNFQEGRDGMLHVFGDDALNHQTSDEDRPEKKLQAKMLAEMMAVDRPRAITTMEAWAKFVQLASRTRAEPFETLDEFLPSRAIDAGELFWFGMLTFAMALTIPPSEIEECMRLARPGYEAISLTNDLYSWRKERIDAEKAGQDYVFNAIWVIMKERKCSEQSAIEICKQEIRRHIAEYDDNVERARNKGLSLDTIKYLEAVRLSHVGNLVWSIYCPRYHGVSQTVAPQLSVARKLLSQVQSLLLTPFHRSVAFGRRLLFRILQVMHKKAL
ncbi:fusicoccadiene synthase [Lentithecium fluviatile CBS 122367]|uniref:Terpene synthase n=1 Tax=Lentithecium fluviatile CBS 122367 TaxID=1168545 RepID=A0A6G1J7X6_9PLEO|nr:fusicoccadiene synthase [Lentithecium fluviatile CBS 122367]